MKITTNYEQRKNTNFKALKEIKFNGVLKKNYDAQRILLDSLEQNPIMKKFNQMYDTTIHFHSTGLNYSNTPCTAIWYSTIKNDKKENFFTKLCKLFIEPRLLEINGKYNLLSTSVDIAKSLSEALQTEQTQKKLEILIEKKTQYSAKLEQEIENKKQKLINESVGTK